MNEMVKRVARAHYDSWAKHNGISLSWERLDPQKDIAPLLEHARAAIAAMREPTKAMVDAANANMEKDYLGAGVYNHDCKDSYTAAIDAALIGDP